ncbi:hypothetical protein ACHMWU_24050 [Aeromicrobium sp. UC242_57]
MREGVRGEAERRDDHDGCGGLCGLEEQAEDRHDGHHDAQEARQSTGASAEASQQGAAEPPGDQRDHDEREAAPESAAGGHAAHLLEDLQRGVAEDHGNQPDDRPRDDRREVDVDVRQPPRRHGSSAAAQAGPRGA